MSPGSSSSSRPRGFFKRVTHGVKRVFKPGDKAPASPTPSPPPETTPGGRLPQPTPSHEPALGVTPQPYAHSPQPATLAQPTPSSSRPVSASNLAVDRNESAHLGSSLSQATKKAGADAWSGLKTALQLLEKTSDVFPPVKSAVGGFLGVVDMFEVSALISHIPRWCSFCAECSKRRRTGRTTQSSPRISEGWWTSSRSTRASRRHPRCPRR